MICNVNIPEVDGQKYRRAGPFEFIVVHMLLNQSPGIEQTEGGEGGRVPGQPVPVPTYDGVLH